MQDKNLQTELATLEQEEKSYWTKLKEQKADVENYILSNDENPALYVGTYRKYNEGSLFGAWIDLTMCDSYEEFMEVCHLLHADEDDPELMYQDFMYFPENWYCECGIDEETFDKIIEYAEMDDKEAFKAYIEATGNDDVERFRERYMGEWNSEEDFAEHIVNECYNLESHGILAQYFDYAAFARSLFSDGYTYYGGYVFCDC